MLQYSEEALCLLVTLECFDYFNVIQANGTAHRKDDFTESTECGTTMRDQCIVDKQDITLLPGKLDGGLACCISDVIKHDTDSHE